MYERCQQCRRRFGRNTVIRAMPIGRRLAFDAARGRLWVVCTKCEAWNLTPLEERWEAVEQCEALFTTGDMRVSSRVGATAVGITRSGNVELLRLGDAPRDEIANIRYGARLLKRAARRRWRTTAGGVAAGTVVGAFVLAGLQTGSALATVVASGFGVYHATTFGIAADRFRLARVQRGDGRSIWMTAKDLETIYVPGKGRRGKQLSTDLAIWNGRDMERLCGDHVLFALAAILPALNAAGGSIAVVQTAVRTVDQAEAAVARNSGDPQKLVGKDGRAAWQRLLTGGNNEEPHLWLRPREDLLALEMAVTEEVERRALERDAARAHPHAARESEVAAIADDMFVPQLVLDWVDRYRMRQASTD